MLSLSVRHTTHYLHSTHLYLRKVFFFLASNLKCVFFFGVFSRLFCNEQVSKQVREVSVLYVMRDKARVFFFCYFFCL